MQWAWDENKNLSNRRKHGVSFELASRVFDDGLALSRPDPNADEERWQTIGIVHGMMLFVVHTWPENAPDSTEETGRIISARKTTPSERKFYEEGEF